jgi:hypothetical protein
LFAIPLAPEARAATQWSLIMYSDHGEWIGEGKPKRFDSGNATLQVLFSDTRALTLRIDSPATDEYYFFEIAAPPGRVLAPGVYDPARLDVGGSGRGCNVTPGRFEILDVDFGAAGELRRLWLVYEQHCEGYPRALFGELRFGEPPSPVVPAVVRWPVSDVGHVDTAAPVLVRPQGTVAGVSIAGRDAGQFQITSDQCTGKTLAGGAACTVSVRHVPTAPGTHLATLRVAKSGGGAEEASLQGFAFGGTTKFTYVSDRGDFVGGGGHGEYTPASVVIWPLWTLDHVRVFIDGISGTNGNSFLAEFEAAAGEPFTPGTYLGAARWPFNEPAPGLSVTGFGNGCNRITGHFTVSEIAFDAVGNIARFGASYEQHCEGAPPALRGELDYRLGDRTPLAPWMGIGPITSVPPRGSGGNQGSGTTTSVKTSKLVKVASLSGLRLSPKAFRAGRRYGTRVRFLLDGPARVRFVVKRRSRRPVRVGKAFTRRASAGPNSFRFTGRLSGRRLRPGQYLLIATPTTGGRRGHAVKARFRVIAPRG